MGSRYDGTEDEVRALSAFINLMRATDTLCAGHSRRLAPTGLTQSQFGVLETLHHLGPLPQTTLGMKLLKTSGNMTMVVANLEKRGLVERRRKEEDRRFVTVHLTALGRRLVKRVLPDHLAGIATDLARLTRSEQDELRRLCRKLGKPQED